MGGKNEPIIRRLQVQACTFSGSCDGGDVMPLRVRLRVRLDEVEGTAHPSPHAIKHLHLQNFWPWNYRESYILGYLHTKIS